MAGVFFWARNFIRRLKRRIIFSHEDTKGTKKEDFNARVQGCKVARKSLTSKIFLPRKARKDTKKKHANVFEECVAIRLCIDIACFKDRQYMQNQWQHMLNRF
jgi:hypothetical protein